MRSEKKNRIQKYFSRRGKMNWKRAFFLFSVIIFYSFSLYAGYIKGYIEVVELEDTCNSEEYTCCNETPSTNVFEC
ncbi:MAG: hypothetical protein ACP5KG_01740 [Myxococcota bacterium]